MLLLGTIYSLQLVLVILEAVLMVICSSQRVLVILIFLSQPVAWSFCFFAFFTLFLIVVVVEDV